MSGKRLTTLKRTGPRVQVCRTLEAAWVEEIERRMEALKNERDRWKSQAINQQQRADDAEARLSDVLASCRC